MLLLLVWRTSGELVYTKVDLLVDNLNYFSFYPDTKYLLANLGLPYKNEFSLFTLKI